MDEVAKARAELLVRLKELYKEWSKAATESNGLLQFRPEPLIIDFLEVARMNTEEARKFIFGDGAEWAGSEL